jgi:hypothetical protein
MYFTDPRIVRAMLGTRQRQPQEELEFRRRLRPVKRVRQRRGLSWWARQLLCQLGRRLVVLGKQLERYGLPQLSV